jgi:hypothetical protein
MKGRKLKNEWPQPPEDHNGAPKSWMVATKAFNEAAHIGMYLNGTGWSMQIERRTDHNGPCYLVGYYDPDYSSFHVHRHLDDGSREVVFNLGAQENPPSYDKILNIMEAWQSIAQLNRSHTGETGQEISELGKLPGFDRLLYDRCKR